MTTGGPAFDPRASAAARRDPVVPVIHSMTEAGATAGGDPITISGFGFFPRRRSSSTGATEI
jgi:hypothetical protein